MCGYMYVHLGSSSSSSRKSPHPGFTNNSTGATKTPVIRDPDPGFTNNSTLQQDIESGAIWQYLQRMDEHAIWTSYQWIKHSSMHDCESLHTELSQGRCQGYMQFRAHQCSLLTMYMQCMQQSDEAGFIQALHQARKDYLFLTTTLSECATHRVRAISWSDCARIDCSIVTICDLVVPLQQCFCRQHHIDPCAPEHIVLDLLLFVAAGERGQRQLECIGVHDGSRTTTGFYWFGGNFTTYHRQRLCIWEQTARV